MHQWKAYELIFQIWETGLVLQGQICEKVCMRSDVWCTSWWTGSSCSCSPGPGRSLRAVVWSQRPSASRRSISTAPAAGWAEVLVPEPCWSAGPAQTHVHHGSSAENHSPGAQKSTTLIDMNITVKCNDACCAIQLAACCLIVESKGRFDVFLD